MASRNARLCDGPAPGMGKPQLSKPHPLPRAGAPRFLLEAAPTQIRSTEEGCSVLPGVSETTQRQSPSSTGETSRGKHAGRNPRERCVCVCAGSEEREASSIKNPPAVSDPSPPPRNRGRLSGFPSKGVETSVEAFWNLERFHACVPSLFLSQQGASYGAAIRDVERTRVPACHSDGFARFACILAARFARATSAGAAAPLFFFFFRRQSLRLGVRADRLLDAKVELRPERRKSGERHGVRANGRPPAPQDLY